MMSIHIEPDQLFLASRSFWRANYQAIDQVVRLRSAVLRLELAWSSERAEEFVGEMRPLVQQLHDRSEDLLTLSLILSRQADLWDESDQRWSAIFREFFFPGRGE